MSTEGPMKDERPTFAWEADPVVLVSARTRNVAFPQQTILRDFSEEQVRKMAVLPGRDLIEKTLTIFGGVTFLGNLTTTWSLMTVTSPSHAPTDAPPPDVCRVVAPMSSLSSDAFKHAVFVDKADPGKPIPALVAAGWRRVLTYLRTQEMVLSEQDVPPSCLLFTRQDGAIAPELLVCRLSEVLSQNTAEGRAGYSYINRNIRHMKNAAHLGALHDYAVRNYSAWSIVEDCRRRAQQAGGATFTGR